jgi:hypothetical protein
MRRAGQRPGRGSELYVQPAELTRKLVKEMEDHKVSRAAHVSVRNRYTVYLCPEDYERLHDRKEALITKLERHLSKHVRAKQYEIPGEISVAVVVDEDLSLGHFGILAEREARGLGEHDASTRVRQTPPPRAGQAEPRSAEQAGRSRSGTTAIIAPGDVARMDLAWQTLVLKAGKREREFTQGRVIVGRAKDVDFRIDDSNVSRRHAAIFWSEGRVMIEDLGSTNGTMVNGYPVSSTVVQPGDVIVIGDCHITVETR